MNVWVATMQWLDYSGREGGGDQSAPHTFQTKEKAEAWAKDVMTGILDDSKIEELRGWDHEDINEYLDSFQAEISTGDITRAIESFNCLMSASDDPEKQQLKIEEQTLS